MNQYFTKIITKLYIKLQSSQGWSLMYSFVIIRQKNLKQKFKKFDWPCNAYTLSMLGLTQASVCPLLHTTTKPINVKKID